MKNMKNIKTKQEVPVIIVEMNLSLAEKEKV